MSPSSVCSIYRPGFGQFEHVQISSHSIDIQLKNLFYNFKCSSIRIDVSVTHIKTDQIDRILEVNNRPTLLFRRQCSPLVCRIFKRTSFNWIDCYPMKIIRSLFNFPMLIKFDGYRLRSSKHFHHRIQTVRDRLTGSERFSSWNSSLSHLVLSLSGQDLLAIEQIESFLLPHTHIYIVTVPVHLQRSTIAGNITLFYWNSGKTDEGDRRSIRIDQCVLDGQRMVNYQLVKPLDQNAITRLGRLAKKTILFALELPMTNATALNYSTSLQLFFPNRPVHSIVDPPISVQSLPGITAEFVSSTEKSKVGRSIRVQLRHLCPSYMEVKGIVYHESSNRVRNDRSCRCRASFLRLERRRTSTM